MKLHPLVCWRGSVMFGCNSWNKSLKYTTNNPVQKSSTILDLSMSNNYRLFHEAQVLPRIHFHELETGTCLSMLRHAIAKAETTALACDCSPVSSLSSLYNDLNDALTDFCSFGGSEDPWVARRRFAAGASWMDVIHLAYFIRNLSQKLVSLPWSNGIFTGISYCRTNSLAPIVNDFHSW